jgi:mannosyltransferase
VNPITAHPESDVAAPAQAAPRRPALAYLSWAVPAVVAAALGLYKIGVPELWRDELASWSAASRTPSQLWAMLHNIDAVLGIYYFGLHLCMAILGQSSTAMRLPSVIAMTAAAATVGLIGKRLGGTTAGVASGLIFALIPSVSRYAQEARPYAFATFFAALATLLFLRALEHPRWGRWALYALAVAAAGAANLIAVCVIAGHLVIVAVDVAQRTVRIGGEGDGGRSLPGGRTDAEGAPLTLLGRFFVAAVAAVVLVSPLVIAGHTQEAWQIGQQPTPHVAQLIGISGGLWQELFSSVPVAVVVMALGLVSLVAAPGARPRVIAGYALAFAIVPVVAVWAISRGPWSYWTFRYMLFSISGWAVAAGLGVAILADRAGKLRLAARLRGPVTPRLAVVAALVAVVALAGVHDQLAIRRQEAHNLWAYPLTPGNGQPVDYQAAAAVIEANAKPGDGILYGVTDSNHYQVDTSVAYYLRGKAMPTAAFQAETQVQANSLQPVPCVDPSECLSGTPRIWVVFVDHLAGDPFSALPYSQAAYLELLGYQEQTVYEENGITVALLNVNAPATPTIVNNNNSN